MAWSREAQISIRSECTWNNPFSCWLTPIIIFVNYFYSVWTFGFFLVFLFCVLWLLKPQKHKSFKALNLFWFCFYFFFCMTNHIATYITFYLYHNNTSLPTQYLHYLRLSELGKHYKTLNTLLIDKKILHHWSKVAYLLQHAVRTLNICSYCFSVEDSPFSRKQGCPYFLFLK